MILTRDFTTYLLIILLGITLISLLISIRQNFKKTYFLRNLQESHIKIINKLNLDIEIKNEQITYIKTELHDQLGSKISLINLNLSVLEMNPIFNMQDQLLSIRSLLSELNSCLKPIFSNAEKDGIIKTDLQDSISNELARLNKIGYYVINLQVKGQKCKLNNDVELIVFRIFQEIITNIIKHSKTKTIDVIIDFLDTKVRLIVEDFGIGFDTKEMFNNIDSANKGMGLKNILKRTQLLNGKINFNSILGRGTNIVLEFPIN